MTYIFLLLAVPLAYFYFLLLGSWLGKRTSTRPSQIHAHRFAIAIAAHNEESVIAETVLRLLTMHYPKDRYDVHVVGDYCTDQTVALACRAGAIAHNRQEGPRTGKGAALTWLFRKILEGNSYDAVVVFDADTLVDPDFLGTVDRYLCNGAKVVQGQHRIVNPESGWFAALTEAKFLIDNLSQNLGRSYWGMSAKNMGDSIALHRSVLAELGWGEGLTEDFQLRQRLLLAGYRICYAPEAVGFGEAPPTWEQAKTQRIRWMQGAKEVSQNFRKRLLLYGIRQHNVAAVDAGLESYLPTFSTLSALGVFALLALPVWGTPPSWVAAGLFFAALIGYPVAALFLAGAPTRSFLALAKGPYFVAWRALASLKLRVRRQEIRWVRTQHGKAAT
ncbi:MAG: glycosyltransferase family 2 protein [Bdellovibrionales bacterium]|nr:glycosyltransferase family 2 protein [Bdellovibrionales bacterium]